MTRKQAKRRKATPVAKFQWPRIPYARIGAVAVMLAGAFLCYRLSAWMLDRPIMSLTIEGPFQRVSALQIEEAIGDDLNDGFLSVDLDDLQAKVTSLPWIDRAAIARRWPGTLEVTVTEQVPAACWGESGLLNTRGELFVSDARHVPAELPRLSGPDGHSADVAKRYLRMRDQLIPRGLDLRRVHLDARGSWQLTLQNGIEIRLGRRDVDERSNLFLNVVAGILTNRAADIDFIDMRYSNGFTIGWKNGKPSPADAPVIAQPEMLAETGQ